MNTALKLIVYLAPLLPVAAGADEFYVATDGDDANRGTEQQPFATIARGVSATRHRPGPHKVVVRPGVYYLNDPIVLDARDSGLIIEGAGDGVVISGGRRVTGWKPWRGNILQADLSGLDLPDLAFRELYYNTRLATWARVPNADPRHARTAAFYVDNVDFQQGS